jgi:hypothetical protein
LNKKWFDTKQLVNDSAKNIDKKLLKNKIYEELATLNEVYEGYQRYINNVESIASDISKIEVQIETNKVSFIFVIKLIYYDRLIN